MFAPGWRFQPCLALPAGRRVPRPPLLAGTVPLGTSEGRIALIAFAPVRGLLLLQPLPFPPPLLSDRGLPGSPACRRLKQRGWEAFPLEPDELIGGESCGASVSSFPARGDSRGVGRQRENESTQTRARSWERAGGVRACASTKEKEECNLGLGCERWMAYLRPGSAPVRREGSCLLFQRAARPRSVPPALHPGGLMGLGAARGAQGETGSVAHRPPGEMAVTLCARLFAFHGAARGARAAYVRRDADVGVGSRS